MLEVPLDDPETVLRKKLSTLIDSGLDQMLATGAAEPALMRLVSDAQATLDALDARKRSGLANMTREELLGLLDTSQRTG